jgi:hypothetical protein
LLTELNRIMGGTGASSRRVGSGHFVEEGQHRRHVPFRVHIV